MQPNTTVTDPADSFDLTTKIRAKSWLGIAGSTEDAWLDLVIPAASAEIARYCNRVFALQTYQDVFRCRPWADGACVGRRLVLTRYYPVREIVSYDEDGTTLVEDTDYEIDAVSGFLYRLASSGSCAWSGSSVTTIEYTAGWKLPPDSGDWSLLKEAPDVERAMIRTLEAARPARGRDPFVKAEDVAGIGRTEYWVQTGGGQSLPQAATDILDGHFRVPIVG